ncbi:MAG: chromate transporter [Bacteroidaceae bacterium]
MDKQLETTNLWSLALIFTKIGAFTVGGGFAMIPLIEDEIVNKRRFMDANEFMDLLAVAQSVPGVLAIKMATFVGYRMHGVWGSIIVSLATALPSFFMILLIAVFFHNYQDNPIVEHIFKGIRPAVVALIAVPTFNLGKRANLNRYTIWIPILSALVIWGLGFSPVYVIIIAGLGGLVYGHLTNRMSRKKKD